MPRLNKIRFVHLLYNNGNNSINDMTLDAGGVSTLLRLPNGGGKSVMTQMLLAPFVKPRERSFPDRPFLDYFKLAKPTVLLQEWILDGDAGLFTVGLVVRKRDAVYGKDGREIVKSDLLAFICEYQQPGPFSLDGLKLMHDNPRSFMNFHEIRETLTKAESAHPGVFRQYNLGSSAGRQQYEAHLRSLGMNQSEWSQMREFNLDESGLSEFASRYNTESKLLKEKLLPAIEKKINSAASSSTYDNDHIEAFRKSMQSFAGVQIANQETLQKRDDLARFQTMLEQMSLPAARLKEQETGRLEQIDRLFSLKTGLCAERKQSQMERDVLQEQKQELLKMENQLAHERFSLSYYQQQDQLDHLQQQADAQQASLKQAKEQEQQTDARWKKMVLAGMQERVNQETSRLAGFEAGLAGARLDYEEKYALQAAAGAGLYQIFADESASQQAAVKENSEELHQLSDSLKQSRKEAEKLNRILLEQEKSIVLLEQNLSSYQQQEQNFIQESGYALHHSLLPYDDAALMDEMKQHFSDALQQTIDRQTRQQLLLDSAMAQEKEQILRKSQIERSLDQFEHTCQTLQSRIDGYARLIRRREKLADYLGLDLQSIWDQPLLESRLQQKLRLLKAEVQQSIEKQLQFEKQRQNLQTGCLSEVDPAVLEAMEKQQIIKEFGSEYLKRSKKSMESKRQLLEKNPFLPFCLLMTKPQEQALRRDLEAQNISVSSPLAILDRDALNRSVSSDLEEPISFYLGFNRQLLDPEALERMIQDLEQQIEQETVRRSDREQQIAYLQTSAASFEEEKLDRAAYDHLFTELQKTQQEVQNNKTDLAEASQTIEALGSQIAADEKELKSLQSLERKQEKLLDRAAALHSAFLLAAKDNTELAELCSKRDETLGQQQQNAQEQTRLSLQLDTAKEKKTALEFAGNEIRRLTAKYSMYAGRQAAAGNRQTLEAQFEALNKELNALGIPMMEEQIKNSKLALASLQEEMDSQAVQYALQMEDWISIAYSHSEKLALEQTREAISKQADALASALKQTELSFGRTEERQKQLVSRMCEETGFEQPMEKAQVRTSGLEEEKQALDALLEEQEAAIQAFTERFGQIELLIKRLEDLLAAYSAPEKTTADPFDAQVKSVQEIETLLGQLLDRMHSLEQKKEQQQKTLLAEIRRSREAFTGSQQLIEGICTALKTDLDDPLLFSQTLQIKLQTVINYLAKLETDLANVENQKQQIISNLFDYCKEMNRRLKQIDRTTTVHFDGIARKMLDIDVPDWQEGSELYRVKISGWLENLMEQALKDPAETDRIIAVNTSSAALFDASTGISQVRIRVCKIEENRQTRIPWSKAGSTSGGESFLSAFVVVAALLAFQRQDEQSGLSLKKQSNVLIMDNPFAKTQSEHLIKTLMQLCQATSTQLIAFTAVENPAIINNFSNIYTLRLRKRADQKVYLESEHSKQAGSSSFEEQTVEMEDLHIQVQESEQLSLSFDDDDDEASFEVDEEASCEEDDFQD